MEKPIQIIIATLVLGLAAALAIAHRAAPVATGYSAKYLCSQVFIAGQDPEMVMENYVKPVNPVFELVSYAIDREERSVTTRLFGFLRPTKALYRDHCGCTLTVDAGVADLRAQAAGLVHRRPALPDTLWPMGNRFDPASVPANVDLPALNARLEQEFTESTSDPKSRTNTLAIVVAYRGRIIAEHYAPGITDTTPLLSWSASKSVTSALFGVLAQQQSLDIYQPAPLPAWAREERRSITIDQLLRMESGLAFEEQYAPFSEVVEMLYDTPDMGAYAAAKSLEAAPGSRWSYSSGTTNILSRMLFERTGGSLRSQYEFAHGQLFDKLGMTSAIFECDAAGVFVGSSYFHASAKDWLRLALLYKSDGVWNGERIFPEGWVDYSLRPTPHAPGGRYGAQIWLNAGSEGGEDRLLPRLPADTFAFQGYQDQWIVVIPSRDLMIARFGVTNHADWSMEALILDILATIDHPASLTTTR